MPALPASTLAEFTTQLFQAVGVPRDDVAAVVADLVDANLRGHDSHGLIRVAHYAKFLGN